MVSAWHHYGTGSFFPKIHFFALYRQYSRVSPTGSKGNTDPDDTRHPTDLPPFTREMMKMIKHV